MATSKMIDGVAFGLEIEIIVIPPVENTDVPMPMTVEQLRDFLLGGGSKYSASYMQKRRKASANLPSKILRKRRAKE